MKIELSTLIQAPVKVCFDLARDIDIHKLSTQKTKEKAIAGRISGLCELNDTITWEANHFGIRQNLKVKITKMTSPEFFEDEMLKGAFRSMRHQHFFLESNGQTLMKDVFEYETPFGIFGKIFDRLILHKYMTDFLQERNKTLKEIAESKTANV